ncbi:MAG: hypothetical protein GTO40_24200, partial [Deltaproteobacteria bacterium]|nr:hypothetical protein [Deltaproteobacteria bacterium]
MTKWASGSEIAKHRGQTPQWVNRKLKGSEVPRNGTKFHFEQANAFLDTHTELKKSPRFKKDIPELRESQVRKEYALARIKEIEAQQKEGSVVSVEEAKTLFFRL